MKKKADPQTHTIPEVAQKLTVSRDTVYRLVRSGDLVKIIVGKRSARITAESFDAYWRRMQDENSQAA